MATTDRSKRKVRNLSAPLRMYRKKMSVAGQEVEVVVRSLTQSDITVHIAADGRYFVGGVSQNELVNKQSDRKIERAKVKPANLSEESISEIVKAMKIP